MGAEKQACLPLLCFFSLFFCSLCGQSSQPFSNREEMHGRQQVGEALEHKDLRRNRRRHSTNWFIFCNVEDFAECRMLPLARGEKTVTIYSIQTQNPPLLAKYVYTRNLSVFFTLLSMYLRTATRAIHRTIEIDIQHTVQLLCTAHTGKPAKRCTAKYIKSSSQQHAVFL